MTVARSQQVCHEITRYYHCVSRCVRRSYLCGHDRLSGKSYEHRRQWVESKILALAQIYCIRICAYAVMSNHYHLVTYIDKEAALSLSHQEVVARWCSTHQMPELIQRYLSGQVNVLNEQKICTKLIETWRQRLYSLSWFMRELNYELAVQANKEDECTGRFWEGRFKSQALLDEKAFITAMAYVDLNPVRAQMATSLEQSDHTSIKNRLIHLKQGRTQTPSLANFVGTSSKEKSFGIPFCLMDYLELVDWVGRQIQDKKRGHINERQPTILHQLSLSHQECFALCTELEKKPRIWIGMAERLRFVKHRLKRRRMIGLIIN